MLAAFLQYVDMRIIVESASLASEESPTAIITSAHIQGGLARNPWLRTNRIVRGRVLGAAPMMLLE